MCASPHIKVWAKNHQFCLALQAEAFTILQAAQIAKDERSDQIIIEGDSKTCFNSLSSPLCHLDWVISSIISNILVLRESFTSSLFIWVKRDCNVVAHAAAKLSINSVQLFCFNNHNLLVVLLDACKVGCHVFPS